MWIWRECGPVTPIRGESRRTTALTVLEIPHDEETWREPLLSPPAPLGSSWEPASTNLDSVTLFEMSDVTLTSVMTAAQNRGGATRKSDSVTQTTDSDETYK